MAIDLDVHGNTKPLEAAVQAAVNRIRRQPIKITVDDKGATQPLGNMKRGADEFTKSMEAANARILAFGASMAIINGVANAFKGMVKNLVEVEKAMADVNVVMGLSAQNLEKFSDGLFKVAKETGAAFKVAADAATEYARQGLGVEESLKRTRDALVLTRLTGMDSAEAVKSLTAAMNTYGTQIKDTTQLVSKFAAVDVKFAVSAQDFADAISRTGQSAKSAGVSIDELVGIVTAAQQKTARGGAVIGNALKTIFTKTGKTDTLNQLENLGIAVRDLEGNTIGAQRILNDLANTFDTLSAAQKAQITQTMGGLFHINILKAVLSDAAKQNGIMAEATRISAGATDEAIQKNEELRKTMSAVATETGLAIKQVSSQIGEIAIAPGMEKILNAVKSLAEGLSGVLGDGEGVGNKFATGLLKGIGNVITGPGLVVLAGVFFKLFGQALKFTKESLTSLVGVTTEKQKQKAIQTSLVALFGQNAALNKEMLRTDIGRTEKEKIILGLLKAQVVEANALNKLTAGMAGTLYRKGYGANLTPVGKKASGHIPNFAHPERAQAAQGGYAAGSIRSMNMPGEGPVIYNSAETVKNFAGFKQPAIMPPQSSKAGKNYQQAFGDIHGFDPYAAGGYIPNFSKTELPNVPGNFVENAKFRAFAGIKPGDKSSKKAKEAYDALMKYTEQSKSNLPPARLVGAYLSAEVQKNPKKSLAAMLVPSSAYTSASATKGNLSWPVYGLFPDKKTAANPEAKLSDLSAEVKSSFKNIGSKYGSEVASIFNGKPVSGKNFWDQIESDRAGGAKGAWKSAVGAIFEAAINAAIGYKAGKRGPGEVRGGKKYAEADFDVRGGDLTLMRSLFDGFPDSMTLADYKSDSVSKSNVDSFYEKVIKQKKYQEIKDKNDRDQKKVKKRAYGHIPNFADPLSDAIGREKAAGVPVSQIRVGSHGALMSKGNPLGLGVTNTHDEPNGLRDVFGANGFVPNYAEGENFKEKLGGLFGSSASIQRANEAAEKLAKEQEELTQSVKDNRSERKKAGDQVQKLRKEMRKEENLLKQNHKIMNDRNSSGKQRQNAAKAYLQSEQKLKSTTDQFNQARNQLKSTHQQLIATERKLKTSSSRLDSSRKTAATREARSGKMSGMGGMGLMMGAPMLAGMLQEGGAAKGGPGYALGGALQGAGTGAAMGMMFGPIGTAVGALGGALMGLVSSAEEVKEAQEQLAKSTGAQKAQSILSAPVMQQAFAGMGEKRLESLVNLEKQLKLGSKFEPSFTEIETRKENLDKRFDNKQLQQSAMMVWGAGTSLNISKSISEDKIEKDASEITSVLNTDAAKERRQALVDALKKLDPSTEFMGTDLKGEVGEDGKKIFKPKKFTTSSFLSQIEGLDITKLEDQEALKQAFENALTLQQKINIDKEKERKGVILQLNAQRAILAAQQKAKEIQFDIKSSYAQIDSSLSLQAKLMGSFATEQQKAQMNYTKAVNKAAEKYATGAQSEEGQYRASMLAFSKNDVIAAALKTNLAQRKVNESEISGEGNVLDLSTEVKKIDLTKELLDLSNEELYAELKKANLIDRQLQTLEDFKNSKEKNVEMLLKELGLSTKIVENEFAINNAIAKRKDLISNLQSGGALMSQVLGHAQAMRGMDAQVGAAQRLTNVGPGYQTRAEQEDFQIREKEIGLKNRIKTIRENATIGLQKEQTKMADILSREKELATLEKQKKAVEYYGGRMADGTQVEFGENERIRMQALIDEEDKRNQAKEKTQNAIDNIIEKSEKEVSTAQKLLDLEKQRLDEKRKHETGPGAFGNGMTDSFKMMREQVSTMDYELGKRIPTAFADGLSGALIGAINGTKSLKEGLMDAAVSFLSMMQQAMMQKLVYQSMGAMGLSRGGNVRKYSKGGGVPAMVSNGEYVMSSDAVNKYGGSFMHGINAGGQIPGFSKGGMAGTKFVDGGIGGALVMKEKRFQEAVENHLLSTGKIKREAAPGGPAAQGSALASDFGGGRGFDSGRLYQRKAMSSAFYAESGNVGLSEDTSAMQAILTEEERVRQEIKAKREAAKAKRRQILGMVASTVLMAGLSKGFGSGSKSGSKIGGFGEDLSRDAMLSQPSTNFNFNPDPVSSSMAMRLGNPFGLSYSKGGSIRKYASGGHIAGKSGIDQIPAMLSEGEYVIRASSARQIGKPMLDQINAGKFNEGGSVSEIAGSSETGSTGGNTNNISISVNMERGSSNKQEQQSESTGKNPSDKSKEEQGSAKLAERIKQQVVSVIIEEQRPGGLLSD